MSLYLHRIPWAFLRRWLAPAALTAATWLALPNQTRAAQPAEVVAPASTPTDLAQLRSIALEKQPALEAYRSSVRAAELGKQGLDELCVPTIVRPDLPYRREQSAQGILAARAQVDKVEWEQRYAVTRLYFMAIYAQEQLKRLDALLDQKGIASIYTLKDLIQPSVDKRKRPDVKKWDPQAFELAITTTRARREEAVSGRARALAALREALGLEPATCITINENAKLPEPKVVVPCKDEIVRLALERRGEMVQAAVGVKVTCLEIKAQESMRGPRVDTFASGSDIHAIPIPAAQLGHQEYRPGAVTLEMPSQLVGPREERVSRAQALHQRAISVAEKTRHLIALEAEDAWFRCNEAANQYELYTKAADQAEKLADAVRGAFNLDPMNENPPLRPTVDELVRARTTQTELRFKAAQAQLDLLIAIAVLERVTAGGFCPGFE